VSTAKVFKSGNSQAVRLPKEFQFDTREVEIFRRGDEVVLRKTQRSLADLTDLLGQLPSDFPDHIEDYPPEKREDL